MNIVFLKTQIFLSSLPQVRDWARTQKMNKLKQGNEDILCFFAKMMSNKLNMCRSHVYKLLGNWLSIKTINEDIKQKTTLQVNNIVIFA